MKHKLCLFTDSLDPSGVGEVMLTLAMELRQEYAMAFVCPPSRVGNRLLARARRLGLETLSLAVRDRQHEDILRDWLVERQFDVFHCHAGIGWEGHHGIYAAHNAHVPVILCTQHLPDLITDPDQRNDFNAVVERLECLICVSAEARASFIRHGLSAEKLCVVRNGIHVRTALPDRAGVRARLDLPLDAKLVLTVARLTKQKGPQCLIASVPQVIAREPHAYFIWVGDGSLSQKMRERVLRLGLEERIHFVGQRDDVPELLASADVFVLPSLFEGLPLAALEAMAAGLPVVGTRVCGTSEVVQDDVTGRLVEKENSHALAAAIVNVLENPELAARYGEAGRQCVQNEFNAARMARETAKLYEDWMWRADERRRTKDQGTTSPSFGVRRSTLVRASAERQKIR